MLETFMRNICERYLRETFMRDIYKRYLERKEKDE